MSDSGYPIKIMGTIAAPAAPPCCESGHQRNLQVDLLTFCPTKSSSTTVAQVMKQLQDKVVELYYKTQPQVVTCVYCGQAYPPGTPTSQHELLTAHIKICEKHPMRVAEQRIRILEAQNMLLQHEVADLKEIRRRQGPEITWD